MAAMIVSADQCKTWEKNGKIEFLKFCKSWLGTKKSTDDGTGEKDLKRALYEVIWLVIRGSLRQESAVATFQEIAELHPDIPSLLADVFSVIDIETAFLDEKDTRNKLLTLIPSCLSVIPEGIWKERLDNDTLEEASIVDSKQSFQSKYIKLKTKLYYKQQKFNLLREENEGYSKLLTELNQEFNEDFTAERALENVRALIGCFNLDPNRVLDMILESFECRLEQDTFFVSVIQSYLQDRDTLCHILGFKFHFYQQTDDTVTPKTLYKLTALLLYHNLVDLDSLYPHLSPSNSDIQERYQKQVQEAKDFARRMTIVVLGEKKDNKDKEKEDKDREMPVDNQKQGLCEALLYLGAWEQAKAILDGLPPFSMVSYEPIAKVLCRLIHYTIEPIYVDQAGLPRLVLKRRKKVSSVRGMKQVKTFEELNSVAFPILCYLGPHLACDAILMGKFIRLARAFMQKRSNDPNPVNEEILRGLLTVMDEVILPTLSLMPNNCSMSEELWSFLKLLKYEYRYRLYGQWKNETYLQHPRLIRARAECIDKAKYIMKRLAKENVKPLGRQIGKLSHSNPAILFEYLLSTIQKFDNFIGPVVDSLKYLSALSYDIMAYCIIEALANPEKERLKHDDTNISLWLQSLASFSGSLFKKYQIELGGLMQYVGNQLKAGKSYDLLILREVVQKMAGIEISEEVTDDQLEAMGGGELLRQEGGYFSQVRNTKKSSSRLKDSLMEHDLAIPMCILMAQQKASILYDIPDSKPIVSPYPMMMPEIDKRHIKLIGKLYDQCQDTFAQFISFLTMQLNVDEIGKRLPTIDILLSTYHVPPDAAFSLARSIYSHSINSKFDELRKIDKKEKQSGQGLKVQRYQESVDHVMSPVTQLMRSTHPPKFWEDLSPEFYTTFWTLSMYDLCVPHVSYEKQAQQLENQITGIEDNKDMAQSKKKKERERCVSLKDKLADEEKRQQEHVKMVMARLEHEKELWFQSRSTKNISISAFLQQCVFPRCCFTAIDAIYCAKFIHTLHKLKTPNFSSLICYDRIFGDVTFSVTSCTESEAHRYGRFLCAALDTIMRWHSDKNIFEKECFNYPGFVTVFRKPVKPGQQTLNNKADQLDYENFRHVVHKWHFALSKAMVACLESTNYIQIRNALIVLIKILPHYPRLMKFGMALERRVDKLCQEEKENRPDLYAIAMGYCGQLKAKKKFWVQESEFHNRDNKDTPKAASAKSNGPSSTSESKPAAASASNNKKADSEGKDSKEKDVKQSISKSEIKANKPDTKMSKSEAKMKEQQELKVKLESKETKMKEPKEGKVKLEPKEMKMKEPKEGKNKDGKIKSDAKSKEAKGNKSGASSAEIKAEKKEAKERKEEKKAKKLRIEEKEEKMRKTKVKEEKQYREEMAVREKEERLHERSYSKEERSSSVASNGSSHGSHHGHRRSAEPSPKLAEDRDVKRRKIEAPSKQESSHGHSSYYDTETRNVKLHKSPCHDRGDRDREYDREYEREKERQKESRKRQERVEEREYRDVETKRYKTEGEIIPGRSGRGVQNGDSEDKKSRREEHHMSRSPKEKRTSKPREVEIDDHLPITTTKKIKKEPAEFREKERKSEKHKKSSKK